VVWNSRSRASTSWKAFPRRATRVRSRRSTCGPTGARYDVVAKVLAGAQRNHMKKIGFVNVAEFKD
jgi:hypothetical protein